MGSSNCSVGNPKTQGMFVASVAGYLCLHGRHDAHLYSVHIAEYHDCALLQNTCMKNKDSRAAVKFGQKTGSRSYAAHLYAAVRTLLQNFLLHLTLVSTSLCSVSW